MLYFPQLTSGAVSQLPVTQRTIIRTVSNELAGGDTIRMADPNDGIMRWQLQYSNLTDTEWLAIEQLFEAAEGRLTTFTFLDPTNNLLSWSEDWTKAVWTADPLLQIVTGIGDPLGGNNAVQLTNSAQTTERVLQSIAGASSFQYCFSVYLRSDVAAVIQLVASATGQDSLVSVSIGPTWVRAVRSGSLSVNQGSIAFGVQLPAGARIDAFGAQVEAQPAPGQYKKTTDRGGVYVNARFDSDALVCSKDAANQNSAVFTLYSNF